jgi:glutamine---fructose-6-phosphate transaminase (isomerizing)
VSTLEQEIREQGDVLRHRLEHGDVRAAAKTIGDARHVVIAARGTSDNAARYAQYLWGRELRLLVGLAAPSLYGDERSAPDLGDAVVIGISQSGQSPDIVSVLAAARTQRRPTIALTNDARSPLAQQADIVVDLLAGPERAVAATKTYTATLVAIAQIAEAIRPTVAARRTLHRLPDEVDALVAAQLATRKRFDALDGVDLVTVVGRGFDYATAYETALKLREMTAIPAEAFSPADLAHGPIAAVGSRGAAWLISGSTPASNELITLWSDVRARTRTSVAVAADTAQFAPAIALPDIPAWAQPVLSIIPGQVASLRLAERGGVTVDAPNGLTKVTLTT